MVNSTIPEELQQIIKDIIANEHKKDTGLDTDILDRLYVEILPEEYNYYPEETEEKQNPIVIKL